MDILEQDLTDRLHRIGDGVALPATAPEHDVRRGRARLRRRRALTLAGSALAVSAVAAGVGLAGPLATGSHPPDLDRADDPAAVGVAPARADLPRRDVAEVAGALAEEDPSGPRPQWDPDQVTATAEALDEQLGDRPWVWLGIGSARTWAGAGAPDCPSGWTCQDADVEGASRARTATDGRASQVVAEFPDGVVIVTVDHSEHGTGDTAYQRSTAGAGEAGGLFIRVPNG